MQTRTALPLLALTLLSTACVSKAERDRQAARADSAQALADRRTALLTTLTAQKDSIATVLDDANSFVAKIDESMSRVKGLPRPKRAKQESIAAEQIQARKDMLARVDALVARAQRTARELEEARKKEATLLAENSALRDSLAAQGAEVARLVAQLEAQAKTITELETRLATLDQTLNEARAAYAKAYYVIGTEKELEREGIVVKEGGANLLVHRFGRTVVPARALDPAKFHAIDTREVTEIPVPDPKREYRIVSRHSLDDAKVEQREGTSFKGAIHIADAEKFWGPSRYLIIVQR